MPQAGFIFSRVWLGFEDGLSHVAIRSTCRLPSPFNPMGRTRSADFRS